MKNKFARALSLAEWAAFSPTSPSHPSRCVDSLHIATLATVQSHIFLDFWLRSSVLISLISDMWAMCVHFDIKFICYGEGPPQWLATGPLERRPAFALLAGPGAPQLNRNQNYGLANKLCSSDRNRVCLFGCFYQKFM
jgi:hypothetical protein